MGFVGEALRKGLSAFDVWEEPDKLNILFVLSLFFFLIFIRLSQVLVAASSFLTRDQTQASSIGSKES